MTSLFYKIGVMKKIIFLLSIISLLGLALSCGDVKNFNEIKEKPVIISPASSDCLTEYDIKFVFTPCKNSEEYELFINGDPVASSSEEAPNDKKITETTDANGNTLLTYTYTIPDDKIEYKSYVRAKNKFQYMQSQIRFFGFRPPAPDLYEPEGVGDDTTISSVIKAPAFKWSKVTNYNAYNLQIALDSDFQELIIDTLVMRTVFTPDLKPENYYWRVACYSKNCPKEKWAWSEVRRFNLRSYGGMLNDHFYIFADSHSCPYCEGLEYFKPDENIKGFLLMGSRTTNKGSLTGNIGIKVNIFDEDTFTRLNYFAEATLTSHNCVHLDGITCDKSGNIFVTSQDTAKIYLYRASDYTMTTLPEYIPIKDGSGNIVDIGPGDRDPETDIELKQNNFGLAWNSKNDLVYMSDYITNQVLAYKKTGELVYEILINQDISDAISNADPNSSSSNASIDYETDRNQPIWGLDCDKDGNIYVSTWGKQTAIQVFTEDGTFIRQIGFGIIRGPADVHIDRFENILVSDYTNHKIYAFSKYGDYLTSWGNATYLTTPWGVATDDEDNIIVVNNDQSGYVLKYVPSIF